MPLFIFLLFALSIAAIRILIFRGHKASSQLPIFKQNYVQAICRGKDCAVNKNRCNSSESPQDNYILLHKLTLEVSSSGGLKCPWCSETLNLKPLICMEPVDEIKKTAALQLENS